jgi:hypothetical protein
MRGWLALEAGQTTEAEEYLRTVERLAPPDKLVSFPTQELAARCRDWLAKARRQ